jgi:dihydrofolate synthase / folylpolyglutamate synthase
MLVDKDADSVIEALAGDIDHWYLAGLAGVRGRPVSDLVERCAARGIPHTACPDVASAWLMACRAAGPADTIAAFGSFHTVVEVMAQTQHG